MRTAVEKPTVVDEAGTIDVSLDEDEKTITIVLRQSSHYGAILAFERIAKEYRESGGFWIEVKA